MCNCRKSKMFKDLIVSALVERKNGEGKYIKDCLLWWINEYKVDGFRIDLMGLIDQ